MLQSNPTPRPYVFIVGGLLFGDEGKGTTVEYLSLKFQVRLVIRYNGGPQAMHHVVFPNNSFHCFSQLGSGSFFPNCNTLLSKHMIISPHTLLREIDVIKKSGVVDIDKKIFIDSDCIIVTPFHKLVIRILETLRGKYNYGTTGMGVGIAIEDSYRMYGEKSSKGYLFSSKDAVKKSVTCLKIGDLCDEKNLLGKLQSLKNEKIQEIREILNKFKADPSSVYENEYLEGDKKEINDDKARFEQALKLFIQFVKENTVNCLFEFYSNFRQKYSQNFINSTKLIQDYIIKGYNIVMEGAQGALLDRIHGFYPHITKSLCSADNAMDLLKEINSEIQFQIIKIGVLRVYSSRHGNGPFLSYNPEWSNYIKEDHNCNSGWQGSFKIGPFDIVAARYGIDIFQPDYISLTCLDKLLIASKENDDIGKFPICVNYHQLKNKEIGFENLFEGEAFVEKIKKRKDEEAWQSLELVKTLRNMEGRVIDLEKIKEIGDKGIEEIVKEECQKRFSEVEEEKRKKLGRFVGVLQTLLGVEICVLSFGATCFDKVFINKKKFC